MPLDGREKDAAALVLADEWIEREVHTHTLCRVHCEVKRVPSYGAVSERIFRYIPG